MSWKQPLDWCTRSDDSVSSLYLLVACSQAIQSKCEANDTCRDHRKAQSKGKDSFQNFKQLRRDPHFVLDDEDADVRALASQATGFMGSSVADVDRLTPLLKDKNWRVVKASIDALEQISGGDGLRHRCSKGDSQELPSRRT
eukprot:symbB.v1.2.009725.t1/scaffold625.1/size179458/2